MFRFGGDDRSPARGGVGDTVRMMQKVSEISQTITGILDRNPEAADALDRLTEAGGDLWTALKPDAARYLGDLAAHLSRDLAPDCLDNIEPPHAGAPDHDNPQEPPL